MKANLAIALLAVAALTGCAYLSSTTTKKPDGTETTHVSVGTLFDAKSGLTKFKNTTGQAGNGSNVWSYPSGTTIGAIDQQSAYPTNLNQLIEAVVRGASQGAVQGATGK